MGAGLLRCELLFSAFAVIVGAEQPPRRASAKPEPRHVACFSTAVGVRVSIPGPKGKGAGVQNAGGGLPVVAVRLGDVGLGFPGCLCASCDGVWP